MHWKLCYYSVDMYVCRSLTKQGRESQMLLAAESVCPRWLEDQHKDLDSSCDQQILGGILVFVTPNSFSPVNFIFLPFEIKGWYIEGHPVRPLRRTVYCLLFIYWLLRNVKINCYLIDFGFDELLSCFIDSLGFRFFFWSHKGESSGTSLRLVCI